MKFSCKVILTSWVVSRPARGAWVEIGVVYMRNYGVPSRAPHGARGLKFRDRRNDVLAVLRSRPARGAWVEIAVYCLLAPATTVAPRTGRVG